MIQQLLKMKRGKWAAVLLFMSICATIGCVNGRTFEPMYIVLVLLAIAAVLVLTALKAIKNPPPAPTVQDLGIHVPQDALDAFNTYGTLPQLDNSPVILTSGETAVYACRAERIETKNRRLGTTGSGGGASIRVAKGVSLRTGTTGSKSVYGDVEMVHAGEFVVTTSRIVFVANSRAFEEKLSSISAVSVDSGCLAIMTAKGSYALRMPLAEYPCEIIKRCIKTL